MSEIITEATNKHLIVLGVVLKKVPEEAKSAIQRAITVSTKEGLERAVVEFKQKKDSSTNYELMRAKCLESGAPPNVCESLEEALQSGISPREICEKSGGPPEMCEIIPTKGFKSFGQIKSFCTESGGPAEICESLESNCREFGITKPDDCFRVLSIATVTTYQETSPTAFPMRTLEAERGAGVELQSWEELEVSCLKNGSRTGKTLEWCASLEAICKEAGAETADQCYRGVDSKGKLIHPSKFSL